MVPMKKLFIIPILLIILPLSVSARKTGYRLPTKETDKEKRAQKEAGTFRVSISDDTLSMYSRRNIIFSGYEKKLQSTRESFFITNHTDRVILSVELSIEYLTPDGRQLNRKFHRIDCHIPPGETRAVDIKSWDTQRAFYYLPSEPERASGAPFIVKFTPLALSIR